MFIWLFVERKQSFRIDIVNPLLHRLFLDHDIIFYLETKLKKGKKKFRKVLKIFWKMEHLLQMSKCSIFHNIFKYMIFQRRQRHYYGVEGYMPLSLPAVVSENKQY